MGSPVIQVRQYVRLNGPQRIGSRRRIATSLQNSDVSPEQGSPDLQAAGCLPTNEQMTISAPFCAQFLNDFNALQAGREGQARATRR
jgi:hypothetical protein